MAYQPNNLSVLAYTNGFTLWHYTTSDSLDDVLAAGYFDLGYDMLRRGDMIMMTSTGNDLQGAVLLVTDSGKGGVMVKRI